MAKRRLKEGSSRPLPYVLMKMDIEGSELEVLSDMLLSGSMGVVNESMIEFHAFLFPAKQRKLDLNLLEEVLKMLARSTGTFKVSSLDDETYFDAKFPLPKC